MLKKYFLLATIWTAAAQAYGAPYIILFNDVSVTLPKKASHKQTMDSRQAQNAAKISDLMQQLGLSKDATPYKDLWLLSGMAIDLQPESVVQAKKAEQVRSILSDKVRTFIKPQISKNLQAADDWGLQRLALSEIRTQFPGIEGSGVRVGIIDTGIQSRHPEFETMNKVTFHDFVNRIIYPYDDQGHGTHVSGTIAGSTTGMAPKVEIYMAKAFSANGTALDSWILDAMQWMYDPDGNTDTDDRPHVVNNSWGLDLPFEINNIDEFEPFHRAVQAWVEADIIPIFAAGNSGSVPNGMPGGFPEVISIAAIDSENMVADFSSRGPNYWRIGNQVVSTFKPDFSAPGVDIYSAWPGNSYEYLSGTSMATPHAVGSIALILQKTGRLSVGDLKGMLLQSMEQKFDFDYGSGIINPLQALLNLSEPSVLNARLTAPAR